MSKFRAPLPAGFGQRWMEDDQGGEGTKMEDMAANRLHFRQRRVYKTNVSTREWIV